MRFHLLPRLLVRFALVAASLSAALSWGQGYDQGITWRDAVSPFTPGAGAIVGGPGAAPDPNSPMYICRARIGGSITPGKWVKGNCNVAFAGKEQIMDRYQVAYGNAVWQPFSSTTYGLLQTGT